MFDFCGVIQVDKVEILKRYYGFSYFRAGQAELIDAQLAGRDAFGIMPTGGGKSLCYQIPALLSDGITLVISPLISLMKDQVSALKNMGIPAAYINSSLSPAQVALALRNMTQGRYKIVYVAPERLLTQQFLSAVTGVKIALLAVDEAHCISQWGQDFRPSYLHIADFLRSLPQRPVVSAFTATATAEVGRDVVRCLELRDPLQVVTGYDRPNLRFSVLKPKKKPIALRQLVAERAEKCGIVYCATRKDVERRCEELCAMGIPATRYHAGLSDEERRGNQEDFVFDRCRVMVATNAFGMGIDKSGVGYVIHYNMPQSLEAYYQEAGRAGRDGAPAECILLFGKSDIETAKFFIQNPTQNDALTEAEREMRIKRDMERLDAMIGYCNTKSCLRCYILSYFGQKNPGKCENCGNCGAKTVTHDMTQEANRILLCVRQIRKLLGYYVGETLVVRVLHGSKERRISELGLERVASYGAMRGTARSEIRELMEELRAQGYLTKDPEYGALEPTDKATAVLSDGARVERTTLVSEKPKSETMPVPVEDDLLTELKALRLRLAKEENVPAFVIFSNATLIDMAHKAPTTRAEFLQVSGVGEYKAKRYGEAFLAAIREQRGKK